jgi:hypothetical protein
MVDGSGTPLFFCQILGRHVRFWDDMFFCQILGTPCFSTCIPRFAVYISWERHASAPIYYATEFKFWELRACWELHVQILTSSASAPVFPDLRPAHVFPVSGQHLFSQILASTCFPIFVANTYFPSFWPAPIFPDLRPAPVFPVCD